MTAKIGVSLPDEHLAAARRAVEDGRATSVSAYIAEAIARREQADSLAGLLDDLSRELGPPTEADYEWADKALGVA
jgi:Arc/MetJ-type ribon-helix-helix transcriptional regulator